MQKYDEHFKRVYSRKWNGSNPKHFNKWQARQIIEFIILRKQKENWKASSKKSRWSHSRKNKNHKTKIGECERESSISKYCKWYLQTFKIKIQALYCYKIRKYFFRKTSVYLGYKRINRFSNFLCPSFSNYLTKKSASSYSFWYFWCQWRWQDFWNGFI